MINFENTKQDMQKAIDHFKAEIASIRTGRAVPALIENIICNAYGGASRLTVKELGMITTSDSQTLMVQPWDPSVIGEIRQGILIANVGLTPVIDNNIIRISVPALTTERRVEYVKLLHQKMEEAKVSLRNVRQDKKKEIESLFEDKNPTSSRPLAGLRGARISEDEKFKTEEDLQKITDEFIGKVEELGKRKEEEIMGK